MQSFFDPTRVRVPAPAVLAAALLCTVALPASAETVRTVNDTAIDSTVLDAYIQSRTNQPASQASPQQRQTLLRELTDIYLLTTQDSVEELEQNPQIAAQIELQRRGVLAQAVANRFFADAEITEEEIQAEYESQVANSPEEQYKARHILVESQGQATEVIEKLDGGDDFAELAKENSTGPSGQSGGDLGWFSPNQMVKPFSDAVAGLENGSYTKSPVQTEFGWHVILREDSRESEAPPLDSVRGDITQRLRQRKFQAYLDSLRADNET